MGENLGSKDRDIVASIGLASDVEVLLGILRELFEEQGQQGIDVLASSYSIADGRATVRVANVDWLVQENDRGIRVPGEFIVNGLDLGVDGARSKLHEQPGKRRAAGTAIQPEDNGVIYRVIAGLKEPCTEDKLETRIIYILDVELTVEKVLVVLVVVEVTAVLLDVGVDA